MRLRVQTTQPLPPLKAWYSSADQTLSTIFDLKESICLQLPSLRQSGILPNNIILLLDGFELLNESPLDVVRDGDLVHVKTLVSTDHALSESLRPKKRRKVASRPSSHGSSSSSSESSSESGSESDSSLDASDTSSDACDVVRRRSPCAPYQQAAKHSVDQENLSTQESLTNVPHTLVPPGQGKPSTHSRNRRRRLKRKYATQTQARPDLESSSAPSGRISGVDSERLSRLPGTASQPDVQDVAQENVYETESGEVRMLSLRNKNKKKNFRQTRSLPPIPKIVFTQSSNATEPLSRCNTNHLIPPSEKQERGILPPRLFVTTIDVEDRMWPQYSTSFTAAVDGGRSKSEALSETLQSQGRGDVSFETQVDWQQAESHWDDYSEVRSVRQLNIGTLVGWKELAINPQTLCPEILLILASVLDIIENEGSDFRVAVKRLPRSDATKTNLAAPESDSAPAENLDEYEWNDIMALGWRVLSAIPIGPSRE